jgi:hypothetical protein
MKLKVQRIVRGWANGRDVLPASSGFALNLNGAGRKYAVEPMDSNWSAAFAAFGLTPQEVEPVYQIFTGVHFLDGAHTHMHKDPAPDGFDHVRCNVLIKKPIEGGMPVIDREVLDVDVGDLWLVIATREMHGSTPIKGPERVIKSFGGLVAKSQIDQIVINTET